MKKKAENAFSKINQKQMRYPAPCPPLRLTSPSPLSVSGKFKSFKSNLHTKTTRKQTNKQNIVYICIHTVYGSRAGAALQVG